MKFIGKQMRFLATVIIMSTGSIAVGQTSPMPPLSCDGQGTSAGYKITINPAIDGSTACKLIPLGGYGIRSAGDNAVITVQRFCTFTDFEVFIKAGWVGAAQCTLQNSSYTQADACNNGWPTILVKENCKIPPAWGIPGLDTEKNLGQFCPANGSNPINTFTGNKYQQEIDYIGDGPFPLTFIRHYNSQGGASRWTNAYLGRKLIFSSDAARGAGINTAKVMRSDGKALTFILQNGAWAARDLDVTSTLSASGADWKYKTEDNEIEIYDSAGNLRTHATAKGFVQTFSYSSPGILSQVSDPGGRTLKFTYDGGRLKSFTDPGNEVTSFTYNSLGNMTGVTYPDGTTRAYQYQDTRFPGALTGIVDENGVLFASFQYDSLGRGISSEHFGGVEKTTLLNHGDGRVTVTDALTAQRTYKFSVIAGMAQLTGQNQPGGSGCGPAARSIEYDNSGNAIKVTNFNGIITKSTYLPNSSLVDTVTEAYGTPQERVIQTDWDSVCKLPTRSTSAGVETSIVYDSQCLIQSKTLKDLSSSKAQTTTFTYTTTSDGTLANLIKSIDGPLAGSSDHILFGYDGKGNLVSVKPPGGLVTQTTSDVHGRPLKIVDANGKITTLTYDQRGRIYQKVDGTAVTQFRYHPWGGLSQVVFPNLSYVNMVYDGAHRLTSAIDNFGNKVKYTLDKMGNQTKQEVYDSGGVLRRNSTAMIDLLNRIYQKNGAY